MRFLVLFFFIFPANTRCSGNPLRFAPAPFHLPSRLHLRSENDTLAAVESPRRNSALGRTIESLMGFLRKYSGVLPETLLTFGQAIHEVTQPLLRSTENANDVAIFYTRLRYISHVSL